MLYNKSIRALDYATPTRGFFYFFNTNERLQRNSQNITFALLFSPSYRGGRKAIQNYLAGALYGTGHHTLRTHRPARHLRCTSRIRVHHRTGRNAR